MNFIGNAGACNDIDLLSKVCVQLKQNESVSFFLPSVSFTGEKLSASGAFYEIEKHLQYN